MKKMKKQARVQKKQQTNSVIINLGSVTTLTLGSAGGDYEGMGRRWGW